MTKEVKLEINEILPVKSDVVYHDLINQDNIKIVEWIVAQILDISYEEVKGKCLVKDSRTTRASNSDKIKYVDTIIGYKEYEIILELNRNFTGSLIRNINYGLTRIVNFYKKYKYSGKSKKIKKNIKRKNNYKELIRVIVVNLNWLPETRKKIPKYHKNVDEVYAYFDKNRGILFKVISVMLDKYANMPYNEIKKNERFYKLLTINNKEDLLEFTKDEPLLETYVNKLIEYSKNNKIKEENMSQAEEDYFIAREDYEVGVEDGIEQKERSIVLNMYNRRYDLKSISEVLNLSVNKVKEIIDSNKNVKLR